MHRVRSLVAAGLVVVAVGCDRTPEPTPTTQNAPAPPTSATNGAPGSTPTPTPTPTGTAPELVWTAPTTWEKAATPGPMRKATYKIKVEGDERGAEVSVSQAGGSVMDNINRWAGQIVGSDKTLKQHEKKVGPYAVTIVSMTGEYTGGMPNAPAAATIPDTTLVGAIVELGNGQSLFFKMVGSTKAVTAARPEFDKMVDSVH